MSSRQERRQRILELISRNQIENQEQLQALLAVEGIATTQATISRDLRDLGIIKNPRGYQVLRLEEVSQIDLKELSRTLRNDLISLQAAANLLVLHTATGHARPLAIKIEQARFPQIVGTIAGDDTIFIATRSASQAAELLRHLERLAK